MGFLLTPWGKVLSYLYCFVVYNVGLDLYIYSTTNIILQLCELVRVSQTELLRLRDTETY